MTVPEPGVDRFPPLLFVLAAVSLFSAGALYLSERGSDAPNYASALLALGVGAYLVLLGVILVSRRR